MNVCKKALKGLYETYLVLSAEKMFEILSGTIPDLILLDVEMPGIHGYDAIKMLKSNELYKDIPVIFLSAMDDAQSEMTGLELGAVDYIHKPFVNSLLLKRIETHLTLSAMNRGGAALGTLGTSLGTITDLIDASLNSDDINEIKGTLGRIKSLILS